LSTALAAVGATHLSSGGTAQPNITAYHVTFMVAAAMAAIAAIMALRIPDSLAAETMQNPSRRRAEKEAREPLLAPDDD
jgi:hypothetical protein